jgi:organic radical activating enzyme
MKIKVAEMFTSIQGEGRYAGMPMLFIRVSGCTRKCSFCDTQYHSKGKDYNVKELIKIIKKSKLKVVCFTGGEPLLYRKEISKIDKSVSEKKSIHIETNGDLLEYSDLYGFDYFSCSPKDLNTAKKAEKILRYLEEEKYDIKVVTDLKKIGVDMLEYATIVMPLTTYSKEKDLKIMRSVWEYCVKNNKKLSLRWQYFLYGKKKGT